MPDETTYIELEKKLPRGGEMVLVKISGNTPSLLRYAGKTITKGAETYRFTNGTATYKLHGDDVWARLPE